MYSTFGLHSIDCDISSEIFSTLVISHSEAFPLTKLKCHVIYMEEENLSFSFPSKEGSFQDLLKSYHSIAHPLLLSISIGHTPNEAQIPPPGPPQHLLTGPFHLFLSFVF